MGSITITSTAIEYSFDDGVTWTTNNVASGLPSGTYLIRTKDAQGCVSNFNSVSLTSEFLSEPLYIKDNPFCGTPGSIIITTPAAEYSFDGGTTWQTSNTLVNLTDGSYLIKIKDTQGCTSPNVYVYLTNLEESYPEYDLVDAGCGTCNLSNTNNKVYVRVTSTDGCYEVAELSFTFLDSPRIYMDDSYPLCEFRTALIEAGHGYDSYLWSTGQTNHSITIGATGNYWVIVRENHGTLVCDSRKDFSIFLSNRATITSIETLDWTANENVIEVLVSGLGIYEYSLDGVVYQDSRRFENLVPGIYQVFVRDKNGCGIANGEALLLNYPKFFTPNGDGINDTWYIKFSQFEEKFDVKIFDRQGKLLKAMKSSESWDGTYNGRMLPSDDYWFYVTREDGEIHKGHFAMLR
ncbi:T9SS type B sorting domain-containing protein [Flavobacterium sp.]|uniref:T9SS type B sorting domain-containing protein n=1 Tax=Flavobacterium sp. TaxID=239 RepID=UPI0025F51848|nr:T9SS type B sorting domain-containing protein [Flavobacterium sp.]